MKTISKNARLSMIAVVALISGVNAFGMDKEEVEREVQEVEKVISVIETCARESLDSDKLSTFSSCLLKASGREEMRTASKQEVINAIVSLYHDPLPFVKICDGFHTMTDRNACHHRKIRFLSTLEQLRTRINQDENFSNN